MLTVKALKYVYINQGTKMLFSICEHHKCLSWVFPFYLNTYVMGLRNIVLFQSGDRLCFDVYRRHILASKVVPPGKKMFFPDPALNELKSTK